MTYEEATTLLKTLKIKKQIVSSRRKRLDELRADYGTIASALSNIGMPHAVSSPGTSKTEKVVDRVLKMQELYETALDEFLKAEEKLYDEFYSLTEEEQYIILESYMSGKPAWKIGRDLGYCRETIERKKSTAIKKLVKN